MRPLYLDAGDGPFLCFEHDATEPRRSLAVLLCPPFGWDDMCSYRSRLAWADALAADGRPALRLDLPGTGDSAGGPADPDRLEAWTRAVALAAEHLRTRTGCARVAAIGIGLGGLVAHRATAHGAPIDDLVHWAVPAGGRRMIRELKAFGRMEGGESTLPEGWLEAGGYVLSADTVAALEATDLAVAPLPDAGARRVLLLERDGLKPDDGLRAAYQAMGAEVQVAPGPGFSAMMAEPQFSKIPRETMGHVAAWMAGGEATAPRAAAPARSRTVPASTSSASLDGGLQETPIDIEVPAGNRLFGVLAERHQAAPDPPGCCLVLLNAGPQRRTGPNRMWVELARRWAARGVPVLRLDVEAIGDAEGDPELLADIGRLHVSSYTDQIRATLDALEARGLPPRFVLVGLCLGGYWGLQVAAADPRVLAVNMLNPRVLVWDGGYVAAVHHSRDYRQKLRDPETWRRVARRNVSFAIPLKVARMIVLRGLSTPSRLLRRAIARGRGRPEKDVVDVLFDRLLAHEQRAFILFAGSEPLHQDLERDGRLDRLGARPGIDVEVIPSPDDLHTLRPTWLQRQVHDVLDRELTRELGTARP